MTAEEIALELVKIEKGHSSKPTPQQKEAIDLYEQYVEKVHAAYKKNNE